MPRLRHILTLAAVAILLSPAASGYYFFVRYLSRSAPYNPAYEKFDLNALPNKTVPFFIAEGGPVQLAAGDSFASLVSQIRLAAKAWNDVETSDLRLAFGGLIAPGTQHSGPAIEVIFDEVPPGLIAWGGPDSKAAEPVNGSGGRFIPILKSIVVLNRDLQSASWGESFFLSVTHELGHALGLQHSLTSGVMSTQITRATTKARPLSTDDVTGLSLLYPARNWQAATGAIQGRVASGDGGLNMASVVALSQEGFAVSALTHPDGSYKIEGLPPGSYVVYAHPLPLAVLGESYAAGVTPPNDADGRRLQSSGPFETRFYNGGTGTREMTAALPVFVFAGGILDGVNFGVTLRSAPGIYGVQTYSFPGQVAVKPAHLSPDGGRSFILATGYGLTDKAAVSVVGGSAVVTAVKPYSLDTRYLQMDFQFNLASGEGTRHLTFTSDNDTYVLPSAFRITRRLPPQIYAALPTLDVSGNRVVVVTGTGFTSTTQILFDGLPAHVRSFDESNAAFYLTPPPGPAGQRATVVALNRDGQSSLFLQSTPPAYEFEFSEAGGFSVFPSQIPAGTDSVIEILGSGTGFSPQYATVALGSSGLSVGRSWVVGPNRILVQISADPGSSMGTSTVSVCNGLRILTQPGGLQIVPAGSRVSFIRGSITDGNGRTDIPAGGVAVARLAGPLADLPASALQLSIGDRAATIVSNIGGVLTFRIPPGLTPGPAITRLSSSGDTALPSVVSIDQPLPTVTGVSVSGSRVDALRPARPGELLTVNANGLGETGTEIAASRVTVLVGSTSHAAASVTPSNGGHLVQFILDSATSAGNQSLSVSIDGRVSAAVPLPVRSN